MDENRDKQIENESTKKYEGILHAMDRIQGINGMHTEIAYLASQVEIAQLPQEAKRPFYAAIEACYRDMAEVKQNEGLAKLADFYSKKIDTEKT